MGEQTKSWLIRLAEKCGYLDHNAFALVSLSAIAAMLSYISLPGPAYGEFVSDRLVSHIIIVCAILILPDTLFAGSVRRVQVISAGAICWLWVFLCLLELFTLHSLSIYIVLICLLAVSSVGNLLGVLTHDATKPR